MQSANRRPQPTYRQPAGRQDDRYYPDADDDEAGDDDDFTIPPVHNRQGVTLPVGFYVGQLEQMKREKKTRFTDYLRIRFDFRVLSVISARDRAKARECEGQVVSGWANLTMGPRSTMRGWAEALLNRQLEEDEQPNKDDLLGCMVEISIVPHETEQGEQTTKIGALTPYRPDQLDPEQKPADERAPRTPPADARRVSPQEMSGKRPPGSSGSAREMSPAAEPAPPPASDDDPEPWEDEDDQIGAVDPVLARRARTGQ